MPGTEAESIKYRESGPGMIIWGSKTQRLRRGRRWGRGQVKKRWSLEDDNQTLDKFGSEAPVFSLMPVGAVPF